MFPRKPRTWTYNAKKELKETPWIKYLKETHKDDG